MIEHTGVHALMRRTHEERVLRTLREHGALSRGELSRRVGLSRTTTSEITAELLARRAIVVLDTDAARRTGSGRPAELLAIDPAAGQFMGADFGHRRVHVAVADASHEVIAQGTASYDEGSSWPERVATAFSLVERVTGETGTHLGNLQGIGVGVPGPYTLPGLRGGSEHWLGERRPEDLGAAFRERFGAPVLMDNNTRFAALAEALLTEPAPDRDLLYVRLGDGVGGALVVGGRLVPGSVGLAGEFGHVTVEPQGRTCRCGKRGCLETVASVPAVLSACRARGAEDVRTLADLARAVEIAHPGVDAVLRDVGAALGTVLAAAAMTLNPTAVVIGGELAQLAPVLVAQADATIRFELFPLGEAVPAVRVALLPGVGGAHGAIAALFGSPLLEGAGETTPRPAARGAAVELEV